MDAYVTCSTMGGIGQLLFQLAHCLSYAKCNGFIPCAPLSSLSPEMVDRLNMKAYFVSDENAGITFRDVFFPCLYDGKNRDGEANARMVGLVQGEEWLMNKEIVRDWLSPLRAPLIPHSVGLHIRGGESRAMGGESLTPDYVRATLQRDYTKGEVLYIFTDDREYAEELLLPIRERLEEMFPDTRWYVSDGTVDTDLTHLRRMTAMKKMICSASSFSWWGAWLGNARDVYWPFMSERGGWNQYMSALRSKGWEWLRGKWDAVRVDEKEECDLLIVIQSCRRYKERRDTCRKSWLTHLPFGVKYFFAVGGDLWEDMDEPDVAAVHSSDDYFHLHLKTREMFRYALEHYRFNYLLKCDDDTYVVTDRAQKLAQGCEFLSDRYSTATGGGGYFLSRASTERLVEELGTGDIEYIPEDVMVTKCMDKLRVKRKGSMLLFRHCTSYIPTSENDYVTAHYVYEDMARIIEHVLYSPNLTALCWITGRETNIDSLPVLYLYLDQGSLRFVINRIAKWHGKAEVLPNGALKLVSDGRETDLILRHVGDGYWEEEKLGFFSIVSPLFPSAIDDLLLQSEGNGVE